MDDDKWALDVMHEALRNSIDEQVYGFRDRWLDRLEQRQEDLHRTEKENSTLRDRVNELLAENAKLKSDISSLQSANTDQCVMDQPQGIITTHTPSTKFGDRVVPYQDWNDLIEKYNALAKKYKQQRLIILNHQDSRNKAKQVIRGWQNWAELKEAAFEKQEQSIAEKERQLGMEETFPSEIRRPPPFSGLFEHFEQTPLPSSAATAAEFLPITPLSITPIRPQRLLPNGMSFDAVEVEAPYNFTAQEGLHNTAANVGFPEPAHLGSSQTTQDEPDHVPSVNLPAHSPDSDVPEVILERPVKRKRNPPKPQTKAEQESNEERRLRIKQEPLSSPPRVTEVRQLLNRTETLDLDEVDEEINTPRKRRRMHPLLQSQRPSFRAAQMKNLQTERSNSLPRDFVAEISDLKEEDNTHDSFRIYKDENELDLEDRHRSEPRHVGTGRQGHTSALKEISTNTKLPAIKTAGSKRSGKDRPGYHIHILSEDGEEPLRPDDNKTASPRKPISPEERLEAKRRLQTLLNGDNETPTKQTLSLTRTPITRPRPQPQASTLQPSELSTSRTTTPSTRHLPTPTTSSTRTRIPIFPNPRPPRAPLRSRPLAQLSSADFKPNPKHTHGLTFAYNETVRDKATRRCLPGCTKPTCCGGMFRAMVEAGARPTLAKGLMEETQDESEAAEEERLLRHYLGGAYREDIGGREREETLLRARMELLANRHGKHRQAFERRESPEGFWDTEMPSTQRIEEIRAESERRERVVVEERWREAMREDGRWVFRDE